MKAYERHDEHELIIPRIQPRIHGPHSPLGIAACLAGGIGANVLMVLTGCMEFSALALIDDRISLKSVFWLTAIGIACGIFLGVCGLFQTRHNRSLAVVALIGNAVNAMWLYAFIMALAAASS